MYPRLTIVDAAPPVEPISLTPEELAQQFVKACEAAIQTMLDAKANEMKYDNIHTSNGWVGELSECESLKAWGGEGCKYIRPLVPGCCRWVLLKCLGATNDACSR